MGGQHHPGTGDVIDRLYVAGTSPVHRLPAHLKVVALVAFVFAVVLTPVTAYWAFGTYLALLVGVVTVARLRWRTVLPRMVIELPFVLFAVLMPLTGPDPSVQVLGLSLSEAGLLAAWGILAKGTLGVLASIVLASTTPARDLLDGLERLRLPGLMVQIIGFMIRYSHVVVDEMRRMSLARRARGFRARGPRAWPVLARSVGALFIRSYERGERVHRAMLARGYTGVMPTVDPPVAVALPAWAGALALPAAAAVVMMAAWLLR